MQFFLVPENLPFSASLLAFVALIVLEIVMLVVGTTSLSDQGGSDFDAGDAGDGATGGYDNLLAWLGLGRIPLVMILGILTAAFGTAGLIVQSAAQSVMQGALLPLWTAVPVALLISLPATRILSGIIGKLMPKVHTTSISLDSLIGQPAEITTGTARRNLAAKAKVTDKHGHRHFVMVYPIGDDMQIPAGETVILLNRREDGYFDAAPTNKS